MDPASFPGWERPERNFYRLPLSWFATLSHSRRAWRLRSVANLIRLVEFIIRWTWGEGHFDRPVRLSLDELEHGKVIGRRGRARLRADEGCGISGSHLGEAIRLALDLGLITRVVDRRDLGRIRQYFAPKLAASSPGDAREDGSGKAMSSAHPAHLPAGVREMGGLPSPFLGGGAGGEGKTLPTSQLPAFTDAAPSFLGFPSPRANYFILPKDWISLMARTRSDTLILAMEYLMRHCWGWRHRADEVHWLTAAEVARGRQHADGSRYDGGIGYSVERTRDALERAVAEGWLVVRERDQHGGRPVREYTLRRLGWPAGEWQPPDSRREGVTDVSEVDRDISAGAPDVWEGEADVSAEDTDVRAAVTDVSAPRSDIPTPATNAQTLLSQEPPAPTTLPGGGGGNGRDDGHGKVTLALHFVSRSDGHPVEARGRVWVHGRALGPDEVLLMGEEAEAVIVIATAEAARLLAEDVDAGYFGWSADWWDLDEDGRERAAQARTLCQRVLTQAQALRQRREAWGDEDLVRALARCDVAPETATRWLARWGEERVGAWLATLRRDPRVATVAGLLLRKLQSGQTPPAWVVNPDRR